MSLSMKNRINNADRYIVSRAFGVNHARRFETSACIKRRRYTLADMVPLRKQS